MNKNINDHDNCLFYQIKTNIEQNISAIIKCNALIFVYLIFRGFILKLALQVQYIIVLC